MSITPYLFFDGNCREAFAFYEKCLGAKIVNLVSYGDTPGGGPVPDQADRIAHVCLAVGDFQIMASDDPTPDFKKPQGFRLSLTGKTPDESKRVFDALSEGGEIDAPLEETFFSPCFGMLTDRFGIPWMINCAPQS